MEQIKIGGSVIVKAVKNNEDQSCMAIFEFLDFKNDIKECDKIFIKPNLVTLHDYKVGSITDPLVVEELIKYIRSFSDKEIVIVESEYLSILLFQKAVCGTSFCPQKKSIQTDSLMHSLLLCP